MIPQDFLKKSAILIKFSNPEKPETQAARAASYQAGIPRGQTESRVAGQG
jgi:hypothetical protein